MRRIIKYLASYPFFLNGDQYSKKINETSFLPSFIARISKHKSTG